MFMKLDWGNVLKFADEREYYEVLGFLAKDEEYIRVYTESNDKSGAWAPQGRLLLRNVDISSIPEPLYIMFFQNLSYTINLIEIIPWAWLRRFIDNYATIGVFLIVDIVIAYFIIIRNFFWKNKKYSVCGKIILAIALILYVLNVAIGITIKINYEIADKKEYEVIEQNRAIVSNYDGKFVVMSCEIQDETIILKKGTYSLEDMTGVSITYHKYEKVICE